MNIAGLRVRIIIQKNETVVDSVGNHLSSWTDYFSCWATANDQTMNEKEEAAHTIEQRMIDFTVRYCSETNRVDAKNYRIVHDNQIYNIESVGEMGYRKRSRKFHCTLVER